MASRYSKYKIINNNSDYYEFLRKKRGLKNIRQYETPYIYNPTVADRARLKTTNYLWKYGDRFYQLANQYYNDTRFWWVIALYNGYMTEADIRPGDVIAIPLNLESALKTLRAY
jgi:nucleoid-associated protein YgaU